MAVDDVVIRYSALPMTQVSVQTHEEIPGLDEAIVFMLAPWSRESVAALQVMTKFLVAEGCELPFVICDVDAGEPPAAVFGRLRGLGETYWMVAGTVLAVERDLRVPGWEARVGANNTLLRTHRSDRVRHTEDWTRGVE